VTKSRNPIILPPIDCADLFQATIDEGDQGPLLRKTQHNDSCYKFFECASSHWLIRDCPQGTTFNLEDKGCDLLKACKPSQVKDLYEQGVNELREYLGLDEPKET
jgi:hypothetical protein